MIKHLPQRAASQQEAAPVEDALRLDPEAEQRLSHVKQAGVSPVIVEQQNRIKTDLQKLGLSCKKDEAIEVLVQHLAVQQLFHAAERIYRVIFGSQIDLLKALNIRGAMKITDIRPIYDHLGAQFPNFYNAYSFEAWLNYVKENNLVGTSDQLTYAITPLGQAFLQWMVLEGVTESKPF